MMFAPEDPSLTLIAAIASFPWPDPFDSITNGLIIVLCIRDLVMPPCENWVCRLNSVVFSVLCLVLWLLLFQWGPPSGAGELQASSAGSYGSRREDRAFRVITVVQPRRLRQLRQQLLQRLQQDTRQGLSCLPLLTTASCQLPATVPKSATKSNMF